MDSNFLNPRAPLPTRFVSPRAPFSEHEIFTFILLRLIVPNIELMRSPYYADFKNHNDWYIVGFDDKEELKPMRGEGAKKYGAFGLAFAKYWPYLADEGIINGEAAADIVQAQFCQKIDYASIYTDAKCNHQTFHSHIVSIFNEFEEHREEPAYMKFDYSSDEAFVNAADTFQPILIRQFYWANNLVAEKTMIENACQLAQTNAIEIDQFMNIDRVRPILQSHHIRWMIWDYDGILQVFYIDPAATGDENPHYDANREVVKKMMAAHEGIVTYDPWNFTARFNVKKDVTNFIQQCDSLMYRE